MALWQVVASADGLSSVTGAALGGASMVLSGYGPHGGVYGPC